MILRRTVPFLLAALVAAGCSAGSGGTTTTAAPVATTAAPPPLTSATTTSTTSSTSTTTTSSSTTVPPTVVGDAVNGLVAPEEATARRAIAVKIDNHPAARPHTDLQSADAVYELLVEAGITRLIAIFHTADSVKVGPVRSLRPTDPTLTMPLGAPLQISGAANWVFRYVRGLGTRLFIDDGTTTFRDHTRKAPHNLYGNTMLMRERADRNGWPDDPPPPLFRYGADPTPLDAPATEIVLPFSSATTSVWRWDGTRYLHFYGDTPHMTLAPDGTEEQVAFDQVVVVAAREYIARPPRPVDGKAVPAADTVGKGDALIFRDGGVLAATWERGSMTEMIRFFDAEGNEVVMPPGRVWIAIFPRDRTVTWK